MDLNKNSLIVNASIIVSAYMAYSAKTEPNYIPLAIGAAGLFFFNQNFLDKSQLKKSPVPKVGPQTPFAPSNINWETNEEGMPVRKNTPPSMFNEPRIPQRPR